MSENFINSENAQSCEKRSELFQVEEVANYKGNEETRNLESWRINRRQEFLRQ